MATTDAPTFELVANWEQLPEGFRHQDVAGVGVDSHDRVYLITRGDPRVIVYEPDGRVLVADRENDRIQVFSPEGEYLDQWTDVQRPTQVFVAADGLVYVAEL